MLLAGCARVAPDPVADAGPVLRHPTVTELSPVPGPIAADAKFSVRFSAEMDEGELLAASGGSETVVLAPEADVERAAAAISRSRVTAQERALFVPMRADVFPDLHGLELTAEQPLAPGKYALLVSPRLRDVDGRRIGGNGIRWMFEVPAPPVRASLLAPRPGAKAPRNLRRVRVAAPDGVGIVSIIADDGTVVAGPEHGKGEIRLDLCRGGKCPTLPVGARYRLAQDGAAVDGGAFTIADCSRSAPPAATLELAPRDTSAEASVTLDWPAVLRLEIAPGSAPAGDPCGAGGCIRVEATAACEAPACGPADCNLTLHAEGLSPEQDYLARVAGEDDEGFAFKTEWKAFRTAGVLPYLEITEVMAAPGGPAPRGAGEFVEIWNAGPGPVILDRLALVGPDGTSRPLLGSAPPEPIALAPGGRALAVGAGFDPGRYPSLPTGTPVLRAATQRLLGRGVADDPVPVIHLVLDDSVLSTFPGGKGCPAGHSLERGSDGRFTCSREGGSPGL